ncbi:MAG TPA: TIGR02281 family clan AA aspartic protease [Beijerinckiaceae bacterium]|jgi:aspartyl protease family protein
MSGAVGLALILLGAAVLVFFHGDGVIAGLQADEFAALIALAALLLLVSGGIVQEFRGQWMRGVQAILFWIVLGAGLVGAYSYRWEIREGATRVISDLAPGEPAVGSGGEVTIARRMDGTFVISGRANGRDLRFIFDTGASTVVLSAESAQALGFSAATLAYTVPVATANGRTMAAPVTLDSVSIGSITERRIRALVARPGALRDNLLGMTFLERLASYEVRGNRLILRGRGA